jgi:hypothetical protein
VVFCIKETILRLDEVNVVTSEYDGKRICEIFHKVPPRLINDRSVPELNGIGPTAKGVSGTPRKELQAVYPGVILDDRRVG